MDKEYNRYYIKIRTILGINPKTIHEELTTVLGPNTLSYPTVAEWAKQERVRICRENLAKFRDGSWRLCDIVTGDETWIYHRQIGRKATNKAWISEGESRKTIVRRRKFVPRKATSIDNKYYIENCLKPVVKEICKQRKSNGTNGIKLLHDNARPHSHSNVINYLTEEGINIMPHPPYSPDLAPCDYWLNDYIKSNLTDLDDC